MRAIIQRVSSASLDIEGKEYSSIEHGLVVLLGIEHDDQNDDVQYMVNKIVQMRIFSDQEGKMNLSLKDVNGSLMAVSQFTLHASTKKGNRPSFIRSARPETAIPLYEQFIKLAQQHCNVQTGVFGAHMQIHLVNDGPVTIFIDSKSRE